MSAVHTAMIMAAGYGTRLRPLTETRSKAMVEVGGIPLIEHMLRRLEAVHVKRAVVNIHAHADHLEAYLTGRKGAINIVISDERDQILETGGGVVKALPLLGADPILICNIDAIWDGFTPVLSGLLQAWDSQIMDELLLLTPNEQILGFDGPGDFNRAPDGRIDFRREETARYVYAGVQIFKPELAKPYKLEKFSRKMIWEDTLMRDALYGHVMDGYWMHVGDPKAHQAAEAVLAQIKAIG